MAKQELSIIQRDITDEIINKLDTLKEQGLKLPTEYAPQNALKSAFYSLINSNSGNLLEKCSKVSIANALLDMVIQGLTPQKTQCYFIAYGDKCVLTRSYFGTVALAKRIANIDISANVIFEGDEFEIEVVDGVERLKFHNTSWKNRDNAIIGAYAIVTQPSGKKNITVMTKKEIEKSWSKSRTKGGVQLEFPQEMAKRTVINRACKMFINTANDNDLIVDAYNRTLSNEYENNNDVNVEEKANTIRERQINDIEVIDIDEENIVYDEN